MNADVYANVIINAACEVSGCNIATLKSKVRYGNYPTIRFLCFKYLHESNLFSLKQIADKFNIKSHSSIMHGLIEIEQKVQTDSKVGSWDVAIQERIADLTQKQFEDLEDTQVLLLLRRQLVLTNNYLKALEGSNRYRYQLEIQDGRLQLTELMRVIYESESNFTQNING